MVDKTQLKDVVSIGFIKYENANHKRGRSVEIALFNTTRDEAMQVRDIIERDPCVGTATVYLTGNRVL